MQYDSYSNAKEPVEEHPVLLTKKGKEIIDAEDFSIVGYIQFDIPTQRLHSYSTNEN